MSTRLQKHPVLDIFRVTHKVEWIQRAFQLALKAFYVCSSEVERLKIGRVWRGVKIQNTLPL